MNEMKIAVTGASGFVGKRLMAYGANDFGLTDLNLRNIEIQKTDLTGINGILHLAGMAHKMEPVEDQLYFEVNYELTRQMALHARANGVKQFVYISSTKVYGDSPATVLNESSGCAPSDPYGASKLKAEQFLLSLQSTEFKVAIIRPPLIYGPNVKGNMIKLLQLADKPFPLPFGQIGNARSMVFVDNLLELIFTIFRKEASGIFLASDRAALSTDELIRLMRKHLGNRSPNFSIPPTVRRLIKTIRPALYTRLFGSFEINAQSTNQQLDFTAPYSTDDGIGVMVNWYRNNLKQ